jgi:hypothetical protein
MHEIAFLARHPDASTFDGEDVKHRSEVSAAALKSSRLPADRFIGRYSREQKYLDPPGPERKREYLSRYKINGGKLTLGRFLFRIAFSWYDSRVDRIIRCPEILDNMVFMGSTAVAVMGLTALGIPQLSIGRSDHPINLFTDSLGNCKAAEKTLGPCYASSP